MQESVNVVFDDLTTIGKKQEKEMVNDYVDKENESQDTTFEEPEENTAEQDTPSKTVSLEKMDELTNSHSRSESSPQQSIVVEHKQKDTPIHISKRHTLTNVIGDISAGVMT